MANKFLLTPDSIVFREVRNELVVIQLDTGQILYFSKGTGDLLNFFKQPKQLESYLEAVDVQDKPSEVKHLQNLTRFLLDNRLLEETSVGDSAHLSSAKLPYTRPEFLRLDDKTLDQIAFLCP